MLLGTPMVVFIYGTRDGRDAEGCRIRRRVPRTDIVTRIGITPTIIRLKDHTPAGPRSAIGRVPDS